MTINPRYGLVPLFLLTSWSCSTSIPVSRHWDFLGNPAAQNVSALAIDELNNGNLYAGLENGEVFQSTDLGAGWRKLSVIRRGISIRKLVQNPDSSGTLYATTAEGVFSSSNQGRFWTLLPVAFHGSSSVGFLTFTIDPWNAKIMYAGSQANGIFGQATRDEHGNPPTVRPIQACPEPMYIPFASTCRDPTSSMPQPARAHEIN